MARLWVYTRTRDAHSQKPSANHSTSVSGLAFQILQLPSKFYKWQASKVIPHQNSVYAEYKITIFLSRHLNSDTISLKRSRTCAAVSANTKHSELRQKKKCTQHLEVTNALCLYFKGDRFESWPFTGYPEVSDIFSQPLQVNATTTLWNKSRRPSTNTY